MRAKPVPLAAGAQTVSSRASVPPALIEAKSSVCPRSVFRTSVATFGVLAHAPKWSGVFLVGQQTWLVMSPARRIVRFD